ASAQCLDWEAGHQLRGVDGYVFTSIVYDDGTGPELYVGGDFHAAGDVAVRNVAKWNGVRWAAVGNGLDGAVYAFAAWDDGSGAKLWAGKSNPINAWDPNATNSLASWNGSTWTLAPAGAQSATPAVALAVFDDGSGSALYVSGAVGTIDGVVQPF